MSGEFDFIGVAMHEISEIMGRIPGLGSGGPVACAITSPLAVPGDYGQKYFAYSILRTVEDGLSLPGYLGSANAVTPVSAIWRVP